MDFILHPYSLPCDPMLTSLIKAQAGGFSLILTCRKYRKKLEYWPASGKYDRNTVMQMRSTVVSFPTLLRDCKKTPHESLRSTQTSLMSL